jgi:hypothetical protein
MRKQVLVRQPTFSERIRLQILWVLSLFHTHEVIHQNISVVAFLLILLGVSSSFLTIKSLGGEIALTMEAILLAKLILQGILFVLDICEEPLFR